MPATFVLIHGAWHDSTCWEKIIPLLEQEGHQVLAPDLPGHGKNPLELDKVSLKAYSSYISYLIDNIDSEVILVGHSMSGLVISQVAENRPEKVSRLIYLTAYLPETKQSVFEITALNRGHEPFIGIEMAMEIAADKRSCSLQDSEIIPLFYQHCDPEIAQQAKARIQVQATLPLSASVNLSEGAFGSIPKTYICCLSDKVIPLHHQRRMLNRQPCDTVLELDADHSPFYSCPQQLARLLKEGIVTSEQ